MASPPPGGPVRPEAPFPPGVPAVRGPRPARSAAIRAGAARARIREAPGDAQAAGLAEAATPMAAAA
ncbi:MAG: hypothetical protein JO132_03205, partial [Streptosporangiaceae bacterium]|nr:hypothetical protein [Streptosporangiaceae bacterium]